MTQEMRNNWLLNHMDIITSTIHRYCSRDETLNYDDVYSEIMFWLIKRLDDIYGDELIDISDSRLKQLVGNKINSFKKRVEIPEDLHDPSDFEELYFPDLETGITLWEFDSVELTDRERKVFDMYITGDFTLDEIAKEYQLTQERIRQIYIKACRKIFWKKYARKGHTNVYSRVRFSGILFYYDRSTEINGLAVIPTDRCSYGRIAEYLISNIEKHIKKELNVNDFKVYIKRWTLKSTMFCSECTDEEKLEFNYDKSIFDNYEKRKGFIAEFNLKFGYIKSTSFGDESNIVESLVKRKVISDDDFEAKAYLLNYAKKLASKMVNKPINEITMFSPVNIDHIRLNPTYIFRRTN